MTDNITLPRQTVQQALDALEDWWGSFPDFRSLHDKVTIAALRTALEQQQAEPVEGNTLLKAFLASAKEAGVTHLQQAEPVYKDSTPHLHVGDSAFESWFQAQPFATQTGIKQISRDSYAAGMGDPLVVAAPQQQAEPVAFVNADNLQGLTLGHYGYVEIYTYESAGSVPLYTAPPQRKELSAGEILNMMPSTIPAEYDGELMEFARAVEAKTKEGT